MIGPLADVVLHEVGHAVFDLWKVPIFSREEDAADQFSAYIMLQFRKDDALRLILGNAYQYQDDSPIGRATSRPGWDLFPGRCRPALGKKCSKDERAERELKDKRLSGENTIINPNVFVAEQSNLECPYAKHRTL